MNNAEKPARRRALVTTTAVLTALVTIAGIAVLAESSSPSLAADSVPPAGSASNAVLALGPAGGSAAADGTTGTGATPTSDPANSGTSNPSGTTGSVADIKNVVLVLADDLDWELFNQVPRLAALQDDGMTFTHHTVTDSLCCPSRTSILRGQYIHNHEVVSNLGATGGGWPTFFGKGEQSDCLPVWLTSAGVTTALFGKYLNDYPNMPEQARYVPPGWSQWGVPISHADSYTGYDYVLNENGRLVHYGKKPKDFLNDVITTKATDFIRTAPSGFFLELSTYNPHQPSPVAVRNRGTHAATVAPRTPDFNAFGANEPTWLRSIRALPPWKQTRLDAAWRQRAQSAESVADSVDAVMATLEQTGHADDTLVVVTSDNGFHMGAHRLSKGKRTAYREDTVVPMVVLGPGVTPGTRIDAMTSTIDLAPTFTQFLGAQAPAWVDGRSLTDIIATDQVPVTWRNAVLSESMGTSGPEDPDYQPQAPPPFTALRTTEWLFVVYRDGERELYDLTADPYEMNNIAATADPQLIADLYSQLQAMRACSGDTCRTADALTFPAA
jgi:N-acetylglucosamine-6-sulfatase